MSVGAAVIGSLQFGYNTGVINAPQMVSYDSATFCVPKQILEVVLAPKNATLLAPAWYQSLCQCSQSAGSSLTCWIREEDRQ